MLLFLIARRLKDEIVRSWKEKIRSELAKELELHVHARQQNYPTTLAEAIVQRFYVPTSQVLFDVCNTVRIIK